MHGDGGWPPRGAGTVLQFAEGTETRSRGPCSLGPMQGRVYGAGIVVTQADTFLLPVPKGVLSSLLT